MVTKQKVRKGVITVAGLGTRFLPATKAMPKEMLPVLDKPVLQYIVEEMVESGITEILFVTSSQKRAIEDHFDRLPGSGPAPVGRGPRHGGHHCGPHHRPTGLSS